MGAACSRGGAGQLHQLEVGEEEEEDAPHALMPSKSRSRSCGSSSSAWSSRAGCALPLELSLIVRAHAERLLGSLRAAGRGSWSAEGAELVAAGAVQQRKRSARVVARSSKPPSSSVAGAPPPGAAKVGSGLAVLAHAQLSRLHGVRQLELTCLCANQVRRTPRGQRGEATRARARFLSRSRDALETTNWCVSSLQTTQP